MRKLTATHVWNWLGDRGVETKPSNIRIHGRWALVKEWYSIEDNMVDCYDLLDACNSDWAEPYSGIKYTDSPFIPRNKEATEKAIAKMEQNDPLH